VKMKTWKNLSVGERAAWIGVFGLVIVALLTFILPRIFSEKQSPTYYSSGNSGDSVQGNGNILDKSSKFFYGDTNKPIFKLYVNNEEMEATNGSTIRLPPSREIKLFIRNYGEDTATHTRVQFFADYEQSSNFITANGWDLQPPIVEESWYQTRTNYHAYSANWLIKWDEPIPGGRLYNQLPSIFVQTNVWVPTNYELPALTTHIVIFSDNSKLQEFIVWFLFAEQPMGILPSEPGYHPL